MGRTTQPFVSAKIGSRPRNKMESGTAAAPARDGGKDDSTIRLGKNRESAAKQNGVGDGGSPGPGRWEGRLNHSSRLNREPAAKQISPG